MGLGNVPISLDLGFTLLVSLFRRLNDVAGNSDCCSWTSRSQAGFSYWIFRFQKCTEAVTELQLSRLSVVTQGFGLPLRFTSFDSENAETFHRVFFDVIFKGWPIKDLLL